MWRSIALAVDHLFSRPVGRDTVVVRWEKPADDSLDDITDRLGWAVGIEPVRKRED